MVAFDHVTSSLVDLNFELPWEEATITGQGVLIEDLVNSVNTFPNQLTVQVVGAPPILVTLQEVGLNRSSKPVASQARRH